MGHTETTRIVIADTSVLINLMHTKHLRLLGGTPGYRFVVADEVLAEVQDPSQKMMVVDTISGGIVDQTRVHGPGELAIYAQLLSTLGSGESACLAVAQSRGWGVACDERRVFLREARARLGQNRLINTPGLYLLWIQSGLLNVDEADEAKQILESNRFRMAFGSFRELL